MLYSTQFGDKRIRVFNLSLPVSKNINTYFKSADVEALSHFLVKKEVSRVFQKGPKAVRESVINTLVTLLY
jgi:protein transport protein SEC24